MIKLFFSRSLPKLFLNFFAQIVKNDYVKNFSSGALYMMKNQLAHNYLIIFLLSKHLLFQFWHPFFQKSLPLSLQIKSSFYVLLIFAPTITHTGQKSNCLTYSVKFLSLNAQKYFKLMGLFRFINTVFERFLTFQKSSL